MACRSNSPRHARLEAIVLLRPGATAVPRRDSMLCRVKYPDDDACIACRAASMMRPSAHPWATARCRRQRASQPLEGDPKNDTTKIAEATSTTTGPVESRGTAALSPTPTSPATRPKHPASTSMVVTRSVHCLAATGGITTSAVTSTAPAAGKPTTTITATSVTKA